MMSGDGRKGWKIPLLPQSVGMVLGRDDGAQIGSSREVHELRPGQLCQEQ